MDVVPCGQDQNSSQLALLLLESNIKKSTDSHVCIALGHGGQNKRGDEMISNFTTSGFMVNKKLASTH